MTQSSLLLLIRSPIEASRRRKTFEDSRVIGLTFYELGNSLWKESELIKSITREELVELTEGVSKSLLNTKNVELQPADFASIIEIARIEKLSFYDSSYLFAAKSNNLVLVTEDKKLLRIAKKYCQVITFESLV